MGEAKRRKQLDPSFGKIRHIPKGLGQSLRVMKGIDDAFISLFSEKFREQGRGALFLSEALDTLDYVILVDLPDVLETFVEPGKRQAILKAVETYNPEAEGVHVDFDTGEFTIYRFGAAQLLVLPKSWRESDA